MKKALAEIIAGVIPNKMARNRWRGLLRYGALRAWRLKRRMKRDTTPPEYYLAVCAIAKNEVPFISKNGLNGTASRESRNSTSTTTEAPTKPAACLLPTLRRAW